MMGVAAYLVTRRGTQSIVDLTETVRQPFDHVFANVIGRASLLHLLPLLQCVSDQTLFTGTKSNGLATRGGWWAL